MTDHYATLGVAKNATPSDIKKAYRRLAAIHHPDKGGDTAEFQKVQAAYETLSDPQKKQQYDNPQSQGFSFGSSGFPGGFQFHHHGFDINDIFGQMFGANPRSQRPHQPSYRTTIWVNLEQVYSGGEQILQFNHNGNNDVVKVQIPKGVENGQTLRFDNLIKDAILIAEFRVHPHQKFERNGSDLYSILDINLLDLIVGTTVDFVTLGGKKLEVTVSPKTQPGATLRIAGEGLPYSGGVGDQFVVLKPYMPDIIDTRIIDSINQSKGN